MAGIPGLMRRVGVPSGPDADKIRRKAEELVRLANVKCGSMGKSEICKPAACLELACSVLGAPVDRRRVIKHCGAPKKTYELCASTLHALLGCSPGASKFSELVVQFGCMRLLPFCREVNTTFQKRFLASLPAARRQHADFSRPVFKAAVFYACARKRKVRVDKAKLVASLGVSETEWRRVLGQVCEFCEAEVGVVKPAKSRKEESADDLGVEVVERKEAYEEWKAQIASSRALGALSSATSNNKEAGEGAGGGSKPAAKAKQSSLSAFFGGAGGVAGSGDAATAQPQDALRRKRADGADREPLAKRRHTDSTVAVDA